MAALASLRLAVLVLSGLAVACLVGTLQEYRHGTLAAQRGVYRSGWFAALLALLGVNLLTSLLTRYPWKARQAGFVMAHVGLLVILGGSWVSLRFGFEGELVLGEGEGRDRVASHEASLQVLAASHAPEVFLVDFERSSGPARELRFPLPHSDLALIVEDYREDPGRPTGPTPQGWAVKVALEQDGVRGPSEWLRWAEVQSRPLGSGVVRLGFLAPEAPLPFRVTLLATEAEYDPGSSRLAAYRSRVRIDDVERGSSTHAIAMNRPLRYRGYTFFQAGYREGDPRTSIFTVARAPGLPMVYAGAPLVVLGVAGLLYAKPSGARVPTGQRPPATP